MAERPRPLPASEYSKYAPGSLASNLLRGHGVTQFPVSTELLKAIGTGAFGLPSNTQQGEFQFDGERFAVPASHDARYQLALELGGVVYQERYQQELLARNLLAPKYLVDQEGRKALFGHPGFREAASIAVAADMPSHVAIQRVRDIRNNTISHLQIIAGLPEDSAQKGYIWTARGIRFDGSGVRPVAREIEQMQWRESPRILLARTEYDKSVKIFRLSGGETREIQRPGGEREKLLQFSLGKKVHEVQGEMYEQWAERQEINGSVVINLDPLVQTREAV